MQCSVGGGNMANHLYDVKARGASDVKRKQTKKPYKQMKSLNKILLVSIGVLSLSHASPSPEYL